MLTLILGVTLTNSMDAFREDLPFFPAQDFFHRTQTVIPVHVQKLLVYHQATQKVLAQYKVSTEPA